MSPWTKPLYLERVWCIFEIYTAETSSECNVTILMPQREKDSFDSFVRNHRDVHQAQGMLNDALADTKIENARAELIDACVNVPK